MRRRGEKTSEGAADDESCSYPTYSVPRLTGSSRCELIYVGSDF